MAKTRDGIKNLKLGRDGELYFLGEFSARYASVDDLIAHHRLNSIRVGGVATAFKLTHPVFRRH